MTYAYNTRGLPAVGSGLPGLPVRSKSEAGIGDVRFFSQHPGEAWVALDGGDWDFKLGLPTWDDFSHVTFPHAVLPGNGSIAFSFSADNTHLASADTTTLRIYKRSGNSFTSYATTNIQSSDHSPVLSSDGKFLVMGSVKLFRKNSNDNGYTQITQTGLPAFYGAYFSDDDTKLVTGAGVYRFDKISAFSLISPAFSDATYPAICNSSASVVAKLSPSKIDIYRLNGESYEKQQEIPIPVTPGGYASAAMSPDGRVFAYTQSTNSSPRIYELSASGEYEYKGGAGTGGTAVLVSPDGLNILTGAAANNFLSRNKKTVDGDYVYKNKVAGITSSYAGKGLNAARASADGAMIGFCGNGTSLSVLKAVKPQLQDFLGRTAYMKVS